MSLLYLVSLTIHQPGILEGVLITGCQHDGEHAQPLNSPTSTLTIGVRIGYLISCLVLPSGHSGRTCFLSDDLPVQTGIPLCLLLTTCSLVSHYGEPL